MRAYSINRPIDLFTYPKQYEYADKVNFPRRQYVEEIGREAWGYIDYVEDVPREELDRYELVVARRAEDKKREELRRYAEHVAHRMRQGWESQAERLFDRGVEKFGFDAEELDVEVGRALHALEG